MNHRILIVDDEEAILKAIGRVLSKASHETVLANHGEEAVSCMEREVFDLLITDLKLPGISGIRVIEQFKKRFPQGQVIVITGFPSLETAQEAVGLGALEYLAKPFDMKDLETAVQRSFDLQDRRRQAYQRKLVLVVEDSPAFSKFLGQLFEIRGIPCLIAATAQEAFAALKAGPKIDLVLMDIGLPDASGLDICRQIKADAATRSIPVLIMTATYAHDPTAQTQANRAGADFFTAKPADPYELCYHVERFLDPPQEGRP